jgi:hypothetical protein
VKTNRKGPFVYYSLTAPQLLELLGILSEMARGVDESEPGPGMFECPAWWKKTA